MDGGNLHVSLDKYIAALFFDIPQVGGLLAEHRTPIVECYIL